MLPKQLTCRVKQAKYPYYLLEEDVEATSTVYTDETEPLQSLKRIFSSNTGIDSAQRRPSINPSHTLQSLEPLKIINLETVSSSDPAGHSAKIKNLLTEYLTKEPYTTSLTSRKLKCSSLERVQPEELSKFYKYNNLLKKTKQIVCLSHNDFVLTLFV